MEISLPSTLAITALSTALITGAIFHFKTVNELTDRIKAFEESSAAAVTPEDLADFQTIVAGFSAPEAPIQGGDVPDNWVYGSTAARFTLVEMTDTECPYCKQHFPILKGLIDASGGNINAALMHVPAISEASRQQALAIECAGEQGGSETAWKYTQLVFDSTAGHGQGVATSLSSLAGKLNLDRERFTACMDSVPVVDRVMADMQKAIDLDIKQTPSTMVIDNVTGNSVVLQGASATQEGIFEAMTKVGSAGAKQ